MATARRVAIGGFSHETNTFNPVPTELKDFQAGTGQWLVGRDEIVERHSGTRSVLAGFLAAAERHGFTALPTFYAAAPPTTGTIAAATFSAIRDHLVRSVAGANPEGVLLHLHGAGVSAEYDDPELEVLRALRAAVGDRVPIMLVNDLHGNIGPDWATYANAIIAYKKAPHVDVYERGLEAGALMQRTLAGEVRPALAIEKPPILIKSGMMSLTEGGLALIKPPMFWLTRRAAELERQPGVLNVSVNAGFGDADVPYAGLSIIVHTDNDPGLAGKLAQELASLAWRLRRGFGTDLVLTPPDVAVRRAVETYDWPVILADEGNNTAGGSPGDGTVILAELQRAGWPDAALFMRDEGAVAQAIAAGPGGEVDLLLGGKREPTNGEPVRVRGTVRLVSDGRLLRGAGVGDQGRRIRLPTGASPAPDARAPTPAINLGRTAVICVEGGQTDIVVTEYPSTQTSPWYFRAVGIEPRRRRIIVVQSATVFRGEFELAEHIARMIIEVDTPGITSPNVHRFTYRRVHRPIFPLDELPDDLL